MAVWFFARSPSVLSSQISEWERMVGDMQWHGIMGMRCFLILASAAAKDHLIPGVHSTGCGINVAVICRRIISRVLQSRLFLLALHFLSFVCVFSFAVVAPSITAVVLGADKMKGRTQQLSCA